MDGAYNFINQTICSYLEAKLGKKPLLILVVGHFLTIFLNFCIIQTVQNICDFFFWKQNSAHSEHVFFIIISDKVTYVLASWLIMKYILMFGCVYFIYRNLQVIGRYFFTKSLPQSYNLYRPICVFLMGWRRVQLFFLIKQVSDKKKRSNMRL